MTIYSLHTENVEFIVKELQKEKAHRNENHILRDTF